MLGKDLLYALQTRSKKLIHELEKFTDELERASIDDAWGFVLETMTLVRELAPTHQKYSHVMKAINRAWMAFADRSDAAADALYSYVTDSLEQTNWLQEDEAQAAYQLLYPFHANHQPSLSASPHLRQGLRRQSPRILALVMKLLPWSTRTLFKLPVKPDRGVGAEAIGMLLDVYFYHLDPGEDDDLRADAANLLPELVRADPQIGDNLTLVLLRSHPERADIVGQLIERYLDVSEPEREFGMFYDVMLDILDNDGNSFIYDDLDKITARLSVSCASWTSDQMESFAQYAFFYRLKTEEDRRLLLSKSAKARRLARMIVDSGHSGTHIDALRPLCAVIGDKKPAATKRKTRPQFQDINFKLLVMQELMYEQETLQPRFDLDDFVRGYTAREIMVKKEGYAVIPEVRNYFQALVIPPQLLAQVEELSFDAGAEIYSQVFPYWDGECDTFDVGAIEDIALLPNLKRISGMQDEFIEQHGAALRQRGIEITGDE